MIDEVQTLIYYVRGHIAKGFILQDDLSLTPCFIVKGEGLFAHGDTLKSALNSLQEKLILKTPISERIIKFKNVFPELKKKYKASEFYRWHSFLTGSCEMGKDSFLKDKNIDLKKDKFTVCEFISLAENSYGKDVIIELKKSLKLQ